MRERQAMNVEIVKNRKARKVLTAKELLTNPDITTISLAEACLILGVGRTTAFNAYKQTGYLMDNVPAIRVGKRIVISLAHLRNALGYSQIQHTQKEGNNE